MCHLILLLPVFALPVFWWLPLTLAGPIYAAVFGLSAWMYYYVIQAMRRPIETGSEELLHSTGEVISVDGRRLRVRIHGETWIAESDDELRRGDRVAVLAVDGLHLRVALHARDMHARVGSA
jgi:membrane protein implicated in regulation of membrane protease activity